MRDVCLSHGCERTPRFVGRGEPERARRRLRGPRDEIGRSIGQRRLSRVFMHLGGIELASEHQARCVLCGAILEQRCGVHHALPQRAEQGTKVGLPAVHPQRRARLRVEVCGTHHHVSALELGQRQRRATTEDAVGHAPFEPSVAAQMCLDRLHRLDRNTVARPAFVDASVPRIVGELFESLDAPLPESALQACAQLTHQGHLRGAAGDVPCEGSNRSRQRSEGAVVDRCVAGVSGILGEPRQEHAKGREDPEELEIAFGLDVRRERVEALVRERHEDRAVGLHAGLAQGRILGEDVGREVVREVDRRQAARRDVRRAYVSMVHAASVDRNRCVTAALGCGARRREHREQ